MAKCPVQSNTPGLPDGVRWTTDYEFHAFNTTIADPPPPPPGDVVAGYLDEFRASIKPVTALIGPNPNAIAVKIPTFLYIEGGIPEPITATVSVPGLSVTLSAALESTTWSTDEMIDAPDDPLGPDLPDTRCYVGGHTVPSDHHSYTSCTCPGVGSSTPQPWDGSDPPCGYEFIWRSTPERTDGAGTWTITARENWVVHWRASNGDTDTGDPIVLQSPEPDAEHPALHVKVGEYRVVLVAPPTG